MIAIVVTRMVRKCDGVALLEARALGTRILRCREADTTTVLMAEWKCNVQGWKKPGKPAWMPNGRDVVFLTQGPRKSK